MVNELMSYMFKILRMEARRLGYGSDPIYHVTSLLSSVHRTWLSFRPVEDTDV